MTGVVTTVDCVDGVWFVLFEVDEVEVMRLPMVEAVGMALTIIGLSEDVS